MAGGGEERGLRTHAKKLLKVPAWFFTGIFSGTLVTSLSNVLSEILLYQVKEHTPLLPSPTPTPTPTPTPRPGSPPRPPPSGYIEPGPFVSENIGIGVIVVAISVFGVYTLGYRRAAIPGFSRYGGVIIGSLTGALTGLTLGFLISPPSAVTLAVLFGMLGAAVGDLLT